MKICVLPGDGIGPEITAEAVRVLKALDLKFEMEEALLGGCAVVFFGLDRLLVHWLRTNGVRRFEELG